MYGVLAVNGRVTPLGEAVLDQPPEQVAGALRRPRCAARRRAIRSRRWCRRGRCRRGRRHPSRLHSNTASSAVETARARGREGLPPRACGGGGRPTTRPRGGLLDGDRDLPAPAALALRQTQLEDAVAQRGADLIGVVARRLAQREAPPESVATLASPARLLDAGGHAQDAVVERDLDTGPAPRPGRRRRRTAPGRPRRSRRPGCGDRRAARCRCG